MMNQFVRHSEEQVRLNNISGYQNLALASKVNISVANWQLKNGSGDQKEFSSSQLANEKFSQRRDLKHHFYKILFS